MLLKLSCFHDALKLCPSVYHVGTDVIFLIKRHICHFTLCFIECIRCFLIAIIMHSCRCDVPLRNCRTALCGAAFNTFSAADGKFANFTAIFPAHILPICKGAVCCTPACFSFIERMKRGFLPAGGITFSLPPKLQITRDYLPAYRKYFSFHYLQNRKKENGR